MSIRNRFIQQDECVCSGYNLTFECSILGSGATVWQGSAFDCGPSSDRILLSHSQFEGVTDYCNNGAIEGRSIAVIDIPTNNGTSDKCFMSQLHVALTDAMKNKTVECFHDSNSQQSAIIGNTTLIFTTGIYNS